MSGTDELKAIKEDIKQIIMARPRVQAPNADIAGGRPVTRSEKRSGPGYPLEHTVDIA